MRIETQNYNLVVDNKTLAEVMLSLAAILPQDTEFKPAHESDIRGPEEHIRSLKERIANKGTKNSKSYEELIIVQEEHIRSVLKIHKFVMRDFDDIFDETFLELLQRGEKDAIDEANSSRILFHTFPIDYDSFDCTGISYTMQAKYISVIFTLRSGTLRRYIRYNLITS